MTGIKKSIPIESFDTSNNLYKYAYLWQNICFLSNGITLRTLNSLQHFIMYVNRATEISSIKINYHEKIAVNCGKIRQAWME